MKLTRKKHTIFSTSLALLIAATTVADATIARRPADIASQAIAETQLVIQIENAPKTRAIIRKIEQGTAECLNNPYDQRTTCLSSAYYKAAQTANLQRFGGPAKSILGRGSRALGSLPRDGSAESFRNAEEILDGISKELRAAAPHRPNDWGKYYLQISVAVVKSKKVFTPNKG